MDALHHDAAAAAGLAVPDRLKRSYKDETPDAGGAEGFRDQDKRDGIDCAASATDAKRFALFRAQFAQRSIVLIEAAGGGWLLTRWGLVRALRDLQSVEDFARLVGATP